MTALDCHFTTSSEPAGTAETRLNSKRVLVQPTLGWEPALRSSCEPFEIWGSKLPARANASKGTEVLKNYYSQSLCPTVYI